MPRYACSTDRTPEEHQSACSDKACGSGRHRARREEKHHHEEHADRALRSGAERHRLPANELGGVDDEDVGVVEVLAECIPRTLKENRVAGGEHVLTGPIFTSALDGEDDEIAAVGDHPGEDGLTDQAGARRNHDLCDPGARSEERIGCVIDLVLVDERAGMIAEVVRDRPTAPMGQESFAEEDDDRHRADEERDADERKLEEAEAADAGVLGRLRDDDVDGRAGEREQRTRMGAERERHQEL